MSRVDLYSIACITECSPFLVTREHCHLLGVAAIFMTAVGQRWLWPTGGWHSRSTPSSGNTRRVPALALRAISRLDQCLARWPAPSPLLTATGARSSCLSVHPTPVPPH